MRCHPGSRGAARSVSEAIKRAQRRVARGLSAEVGEEGAGLGLERAGSFVDEVRQSGHSVEVLYLDCSDERLVLEDLRRATQVIARSLVDLLA